MSQQPRPLSCILLVFLAACSGFSQDLGTDLPPPTSLPSAPTSAPSSTPEATPLPTPLPGEPITLTAIQMTTELDGWGITDLEGSPASVLKTVDGGATWIDHSPDEVTGEKIAAKSFLDSDQAWIMFASDDQMAPVPAEPIVWSTADGGMTWGASSPLPLPELSDFFIPGEMQFADAQRGWLMVHLGAGMSHDYIGLYVTSDGGNVWEIAGDPTSAPEIQGCQKTGLFFSGQGAGWLTADCMGVVDGAIFYQSNDDGATWGQNSLPPPESSLDLFEFSYCSTEAPQLFDGQRGQLLLRCRSGSSGEVETSYLYRTADRGTTWESAPFPGGDLLAIDDQVSWAAGESLYLTQDGGQSWELTGNPPWVGSFDFLDPENGWLLGQHGNEDLIGRTEDAGKSWILVDPRLLPD